MHGHGRVMVHDPKKDNLCDLLIVRSSNYTRKETKKETRGPKPNKKMIKLVIHVPTVSSTSKSTSYSSVGHPAATKSWLYKSRETVGVCSKKDMIFVLVVEIDLHSD